MAPAANNNSSASYKPLDLESANNNSNSGGGQWRTIEEHERLQQHGAVLSDAPSHDPDDFYGQQQQRRQQQQQHARKKSTLAWVLAGSTCILLLVAGAAVIAPRSTSTATPQQHTLPAASFDTSTSSSVDERGSRNPSNSSVGLWHEGGAAGSAVLSAEQLEDTAGDNKFVVPCKGSELQCGVVNKQPIPEADFRNLPRRATSKRGMVAADSSRCSQIGRDVLQDGGNAIDAAVATALCQRVVNPVASGLGGGAFITVRLANGTDAFWDARETAPAAATEDMFTGLPAASLFGGLAVAVPGELQGLEAAWKRFGSKTWAQLVKPAADLARTGFAAHPYLVYVMSGAYNLQALKSVKALREAFLINDPQQGWRAPRVGELCCQRPKLAETLDKIAASGGSSYLSSPAVTSAHAAELKAAGGIITASDLAAAAPQERELLRMQLGELELLLPPPPSSAAVVGFMLKFLAGYNNTVLGQSSHNNSTGHSISKSAPDAATLASFGVQSHRDKALGMHRLVESMKHGFAVRTALGDPGSPQQPFPEAASIQAAVGDLLSDGFVDALRAKTQDDDVLPDNQYGGRWNPEGVAPPEEHGTSHICIVDADRNAVSLTTSINTPFGSGVMSETTGILFGNTMDDFGGPAKKTIVTPHPSRANYIAPGRRPLSAMSPIIVSHKASGRLVAVAGASGGPLIVSATAQTLARLLLEGADVAAAVSAPRLHNQLVPLNASFVEEYVWGYTHHEMPQYVLAQLEARDQVTKAVDRGIGVSQAIQVEYKHKSESAAAGGEDGGGGGSSSRTQDKGVLIGASDSRKDGAPAAEQ